MLRALARLGLAFGLLLVAACGIDTGATFNADGSVNVTYAFLFPKALLDSSPGGGSVQGMSAADIEKENKALAAKYPGAKVSLVTSGDEQGVQITIPFKNETDAFKFLTEPSKLDVSGATSGSNGSFDPSNTGGFFSSATHQANTYTFKTQPAPQPTPSSSSSSGLDAATMGDIIQMTFTLTVPQEITSASPDALFSLDRKTVVWKLNLFAPSTTLTATTGGAKPAASVVGSPLVLGGVGAVGVGIGLLAGLLVMRPRSQPAATALPAPAMPVYAPPPAPPAGPPGPPQGIQGPPPGLPPPAPPPQA